MLTLPFAAPGFRLARDAASSPIGTCESGSLRIVLCTVPAPFTVGKPFVDGAVVDCRPLRFPSGPPALLLGPAAAARPAGSVALRAGASLRFATLATVLPGWLSCRASLGGRPGRRFGSASPFVANVGWGAREEAFWARVEWRTGGISGPAVAAPPTGSVAALITLWLGAELAPADGGLPSAADLAAIVFRDMC